MKLFTIRLAVILFTFPITIVGQHIKIDKKKLSFLKEEKTLNVIFDYSDLIRGGNFISEEEYLKKQKEKISARKNNYEEWFMAYEHSKNKTWKEIYVSILNENLSKYIAPKFVINSETNYTMKVNVLWIYSGYDIGIARSPSKIKLRLELIDNATKRIVEIIDVKESHGYNKDFDNDSEWPYLKLIQNAFRSSAFKLAITLKRVFDKKRN